MVTFWSGYAQLIEAYSFLVDEWVRSAFASERRYDTLEFLVVIYHESADNLDTDGHGRIDDDTHFWERLLG